MSFHIPLMLRQSWELSLWLWFLAISGMQQHLRRDVEEIRMLVAIFQPFQERLGYLQKCAIGFPRPRWPFVVLVFEPAVNNVISTDPPNFLCVFRLERVEFEFVSQTRKEFICIGAFSNHPRVLFPVDIDTSAHGFSRPLALRSASGNPAGPEASSCRPASSRPGARRSWQCQVCRRFRTRSRKHRARWRCCRRSSWQSRTR